MPLLDPVHVFYAGAHLIKPGLLPKLRRIAVAALDRIHAIEPLNQLLRDRIAARLEACPVADLRVDFEDGFGVRTEAEELQCAKSVASVIVAGSMSARWGVRTRPFSHRSTPLILDEFLFDARTIPPVVTLPKVSIPADVTPLTRYLDRNGVPSRIELLIETPAALRHLPGLIEACEGRLDSLHFGAYDFLSALDVAGPDQSLRHPFCDQARFAMKVATAGTEIRLYDGVTNVLPVDPDPVPGWALHVAHVRHGLTQGFYAGWDVHPAQIPARYAALYGFFDANKADAGGRLRQYLGQQAQATRLGGVFDDAASIRGLVRFLGRGLASGAIEDAEVEALSGVPWPELVRHA